MERVATFANFAAQDTVNKLTKVREVEGERAWASKLGRVVLDATLDWKSLIGLKTIELAAPLIDEVTKGGFYPDYLRGMQERLELEIKGYNRTEYDEFMSL